MTDLLAPVLRRGSAGPDGPRRPLAVNAALAGAAAPVVTLLVLWAAGLVAWFAADGGSHGTTRSVLRVAADGWLLAHGTHLDLGDAVVVTASPLGLTLLCAWLVHRLGRWVGATSEVGDLRTAGLGAVVLGGSYGLAAVLTAVLASTASASPSIGLTFLGAALLAGVAGGAGVVRGAGLGHTLRSAVPESALVAVHTAFMVVVGLLAAAALLVAIAVAVRGAAVANLAERLHLDLVGLGFSLLLTLAIAPNATLLVAGYLLGPGFAVGAATFVSPQEVSLGALPTVPLLGALPPEGWTPGWVLALLAVPLLLGLAAGHVAARMLPSASYLTAAGRGLAGGALGAALLALASSQAGGAIGPGRMAQIGTGMLDVLVAALLALGPAATLGAVSATWLLRREPAAFEERLRSEEERDETAEAAAGESTGPAVALPTQRGARSSVEAMPDQRRPDQRTRDERRAEERRVEERRVEERRVEGQRAGERRPGSS